MPKTIEFEEDNFELYLHQRHGQQSPNQVIATAAQASNDFGQIVINDWDIRKSRVANSILMGRAQGLLTKSSMNSASYFITFNMLFEQTSFKYPGSSFVVCGAYDPDAPFKWAITGGTETLTLATGFITGEQAYETANSRILQLNVRIFYSTK